MAGLQEVGAILSLADIALRGVSSLYSFVSDIQDAPHSVQNIRQELASLEEVLLALEHISPKARAIFLRVGVPQSVQRCDQVCAQMHEELQRCVGLPYSLRSKICFTWRKGRVERLCAIINTTKQTLTLAVAIAHLDVHISHIDMSKSNIHTLQRELAPPKHNANEEARRKREENYSNGIQYTLGSGESRPQTQEATAERASTRENGRINQTYEETCLIASDDKGSETKAGILSHMVGKGGLEQVFKGAITAKKGGKTWAGAYTE